MKVRRVVTGHDRSGKAVFVSDREVEPITAQLLPGSEFHKLWGGDRAPSFPDDGAEPAQPSYFPPIGGFRFGMFSLPPASSAAAPQPKDMAAAAAELEAKLPGLASYMEPDAPGMHTTDTIDFEVVLEGEVWLELDGGKEVHLRPGDTVVQNGTRHAWHNRGTKPARLAVFITGARHAKFPKS
ncbi:MAG TPA: cupin domain-containing protein [Myxococcota bacterium]|nr:cupin domain-containing protein [Myxococcota bacterium]